jgi:hypothetical protein
MAFVRIKTIKGIAYAYYVENVREGDKVKQIIKQYLGRADKHKGKFDKK